MGNDNRRSGCFICRKYYKQISILKGQTVEIHWGLKVIGFMFRNLSKLVY